MLRHALTACAAALLLATAACGDDDAEDTARPPTEVEDAVDDRDETDEDEGEEQSGDDGSAAAASGGTGRLELEGEDELNLRLGTSATAQCSVSDGSVTIQDLRASDGSWVGVALNDPGTPIWEATLRGPDGNRTWFTGNTGEAEGLSASYTIADNVFMVDGEWARADDPSQTTEGQLVVTCP